MATPQTNAPRRLPWSGAAWRSPWVGYLAIVAVTVLVYLPTLQAGFIWNDPDYVTKTELQSLEGLRRIWFEVGATEQYYPLLHSAFWLQHRLWGDSAAAYHLFNVLLHAACACLLVVAVRRVRGVGSGVWGKAEDGAVGQSAIGNRQSAMVAWITGGLFAVHPVYVESVAWISEQKNTQSLLFYLLAGIAYLRFADAKSDGPAARPYPRSSADGAEAPVGLARRAGPFDKLRAGRGWYFVATAFFILAILSKSLTATLPAALLVVLWWRRGRLDWRRDWVPLLPWFVLFAVAGAFTGWVEHSVIGAKGEDFELGFVERGVLAGRVIWFYIGKILWPADLMFIYPRWEVDAGAPAQWLFPLAALGLLAALWAIRKRARGPLAAYLFFVGSLLPTVGFFNVYAFQFSYVADHWNYLPSIGLLVGISWGLVTVLGRWARSRSTSDNAVTHPAPVGTPLSRGELSYPGIAGIVGVVILVAALGAMSRRHCALFRDIETLFRVTSEKNPAAWMAHQNLGVLLMNSGKVDEALARFERAIALKATNAQAWNNLGVALMHLGRTAESLANLQKAIAIKPDYAEARYNLGLTFRAEGRDREAVEQFHETLRIQPAAAEAHYQLGRIHETAGRPVEAAASYRRALEIKPELRDALVGMGRLHLGERRFPEAVETLERAADLGPDPEVLHLLGLALTANGRAEDAVRAYQLALQLEPERPGTLFNLGLVLAMGGRVADAVPHFQQAVQLRPDYAEASQALAQALTETGRPAEAAAVRARAQQAAAGKPGP